MTVAVVGAGLAGVRTCEALRSRGYDGRIVLVGAEKHQPYSRPPLSKEVLRGDKDASVATLRTAGELAALGVEQRLGVAARGLRPADRAVHLDDGSEVGYDHLVVATGADPRPLPGDRSPGVHVLRTVDDCLALRDAIDPGTRVVVVGAGFIGLEVAAAARHRDADVTVVDVLPAPLARVLDPAVGNAVGRLHQANGVRICCGVGVAEVSGGTRVDGVLLTDGTRLPADVVVVGIGAVPATGWLQHAGLILDDGLVCDPSLRAAPGVWAVGDVCRWHSPRLGRTVRVEHWTNATEQPDHVARAICGDVGAFDPVPYFWSDQYDAKLQCLGFAGSGDEIAVVRGALDEPKWVALVRSGDLLGGVLGLRSPGQVMKLKPLLATGASWSEAMAAT
ncbi:MAG TPA: FAD-dependent oxidoreductase, partial [Mycobacteriales bacterium]|nr:FAD-dependent oxidoreductase [Mycobacteriales bacterium]